MTSTANFLANPVQLLHRPIIYVMLASAFLIAFFGKVQAQETTLQRNLLTSRYPASSVGQLLLPQENWKPFPQSGDRQAWDTLAVEIRQQLIGDGEAALQYVWPTLDAALFLDYVRTGNRSRYQEKRDERRTALRSLVLAEVVEGKGRFIDQIVNGIWATCEESYWGVPAHLYLQEAGPGLPDKAEPTVDLFASQTANLLAWTDYLLGPKLDEVSPLVRKRIYFETKERILAPALERDDFWWMGFGEKVNNWNPWIASNWLVATLLLEKDEQLRSKAVAKILAVLDNFINSYPEDGSCDEGPSYWGRAGASLFDALEMLYSVSNGQIDIYKQLIIRNMGAYIYKVHIGHDYYVNFADATAKATPPADLVYRYGQRIEDPQMMAFGGYLSNQKDGPEISSSLDRTLFAIFNYQRISQTPSDAPLPLDVWYPGNGVMIARSAAGNVKGLFLAAQGGHNAESHNHNDVGNFIIYVDGYPALIDAGVGTYTAKTFGPERYSIWNMQSGFHNVPTIGNTMQAAGREFEATEVDYRVKRSAARFTLDLAKAYPAEAGVESWERRLQLNRGKHITLVDRYKLKQKPESLTQTLMTNCEVFTNHPGEIRLKGVKPDGTAYNLFIIYDPGQFTVSQESIPLDQDEQDQRLRSTWGDSLTRILLKDRNPNSSGTWKFLISQ